MANELVSIGSRLQKAIDTVKDLGLSLTVPDVQPMTKIIEKIEDADQAKALVIARTLSAMQSFDTLVSDNLRETNYGDRYNAVVEGFNSIIEDARRMVNQEDKGGPSFAERVSNIVMKFTRGDIADRFVGIEKIYKGVVQDAGKTLELQSKILEAYADARLALKEGEIASLDIFEKIKAENAAAKSALDALNARIAALPADGDAREKSALELQRDEAVNNVRKQDDRYQIGKNLTEMMTSSYSVTEVVFGKYHQAYQVLERLHQKAVMFFDIQRPVMTALKATYTGIMVVNELSKTQTAMEEGLNKSLEALATLSDTTLREGVRVAHGATLRANSVKALVDSTVDFQLEMGKIISESRQLATTEAETIRRDVEEGKRRVAEFVAKGN